MSNDPIPELKLQLAREIVRLADQTNFFVAAMALGIDYPRLSDLRKGRLKRFSLQKLIRILATVERKVTLEIGYDGPQMDIGLLRMHRRFEKRRQQVALEDVMAQPVVSFGNADQ